MPLIYTSPQNMAKSKVAKLFRNGRSQAVRLPKEFRFEGDSVRVRQVEGGVLLEPVISDVRKWFAELDRLNTEPFFAGAATSQKLRAAGFFVEVFARHQCVHCANQRETSFGSHAIRKGTQFRIRGIRLFCRPLRTVVWNCQEYPPREQRATPREISLRPSQHLALSRRGRPNSRGNSRRNGSDWQACWRLRLIDRRSSIASQDDGRHGKHKGVWTYQESSIGGLDEGLICSEGSFVILCAQCYGKEETLAEPAQTAYWRSQLKLESSRMSPKRTNSSSRRTDSAPPRTLSSGNASGKHWP